jgi:LysR family glycine cleavage system transcriptional activator
LLTNMARLPLATLPAFRAVARLGSVRTAAEELHLTHSAISQQIGLLEAQLDLKLFDRRGRRVVLNAAGQALLGAVGPALDQIDDGIRAAEAAAVGAEQRIRVTALPSFAQRWLLPRVGRWHQRHPAIGLELHTSQQLIDLGREGFHAALRQGDGQWRGLTAVPLIESSLIAVGCPQAAARVAGGGAKAIAHQALLGNIAQWERWFALAGVQAKINPVAGFNYAGLMLQAAEQDLGIALARELLAADALRDGRLVRLAPQALADRQSQRYWLVHPPALAGWPPLVALRAWLLDEVEASRRSLAELSAG